MPNHLRYLSFAGFLLIAAVFLMPTGEAAAQEPQKEAFSSLEEFNSWTMSYYQHPEPERLGEALEYFCASSLAWNPLSRAPLMAFFTEAVREDASMLENIYTAANDSSEECSRIMAIHVFWLLENDAGEQMFKRAEKQWQGSSEQEMMKKLKRGQRWDYLNGPLVSHTSIDMLWARFAATGDTKAVDAIIDATYLGDELSHEERDIVGAAQSSLVSMMRQNEDVRALVYSRIGKDSGMQGKIIQALVDHHEEQMKQLSGNENEATTSTEPTAP